MVAPAAVSVLIGAPFLVAGGILLANNPPPTSPLVIMSVGALVVAVGLYLSIAGSRPEPDFLSGERMLAFRHPSIWPALARILLSLPLFAGAGYLQFFTRVPYMYPFVLFLLAMYLYFRGASRYWLSHHTIYYVTDRRAVHKYSFAWLNTTEISVNAMNSISVVRSCAEMITGRGTVVVASGIGERQRVRIQEIDDPDSVAQTLRELMR